MTKPTRAPVKLVTKTDEASQSVRETLASLLKRAEDDDFTAMATVLIRHDGAVFVSTRSNGNRVMLLGAVTDLQYSIAKDGDAP